MDPDSIDGRCDRAEAHIANENYDEGEWCCFYSIRLLDMTQVKKLQRKIVNIFLPIIISICLGCSKEPSH